MANDTVNPNNMDNQEIPQKPNTTREFLIGFLPLMAINLLVVMGTIEERGSSSSGLELTYILFLFPVLIVASFIYFFLNKKHPTRAKGAMVSLIVTLLILMITVVFRYA